MCRLFLKEVFLIQEDVEQRSIVLATRSSKMTGRVLATLMKASLRKLHKTRNTPKVGKQSLKRLSKGGPLDNIEVSKDNIKDFEPFAQKYQIKYSLQKDTSEDPPKWLVFFQSKDTATMTAAFKAFSAAMLNKEKSKLPSVKKAMAKFQELIKDTVRDKTRNKTHGEHEL